MKHSNTVYHLATPMIQCNAPLFPEDELTGDERRVSCEDCRDWMHAYRAVSPKLQDDSSKDQFMYPEVRYSVLMDPTLADVEY